MSSAPRPTTSASGAAAAASGSASIAAAAGSSSSLSATPAASYGVPHTLVVASTPTRDLVYTNAVFVAPGEFSRVPTYIKINDNDFVYFCAAVQECQPSRDGVMGNILLNAKQRVDCRVDRNEVVTVIEVPPPRKSEYLTALTMELDVHGGKRPRDPVDADKMAERLKRLFKAHVFTLGQQVVINFMDCDLVGVVTSVEVVADADVSQMNEERRYYSRRSGMMVEETLLELVKKPSSLLPFAAGKLTRKPIFRDFSFEKMGIGGLDTELSAIFRRAFVSRQYPSAIINKLGIKHVKGIMLYGPPGTGKTLVARQIGKMLNTKDPKVVNGPEVLNKYVGATEEKIRELFADAEAEYRERGDESDLHLIIFDEIDAICKKRGSIRDGTGVMDTTVNQLLSKMDGVEAVNNVLVIGMTNRLDMIDDALLRPGRFEVHIEIGLPDERGRVQIFRIHTKSMKENSLLAPDVDIESLAQRTPNYSGAEIAGVVRSAASFALSRNVDLEHMDKPLTDVVLEMRDFESALAEVQPAFGVSQDEAEVFLSQGIIDFSDEFHHLYYSGKAFIRQLINSDKTHLFTLLLDGYPRTGKTCLAATLAIESKFPFVKFVTPDSMVGMPEGMKVTTIAKVFDDAYKSPLSIIVLDNIERLLEYVALGPRFSNAVLQTLLVLLGKQPPKGRKLMVIATTSMKRELTDMGLVHPFNVNRTMPTLDSPDEIEKALAGLQGVTYENLPAIVAACPMGMRIKQLLMVVEMAQYGNAEEMPSSASLSSLPEAGGSSSTTRRPVTVERFTECIAECRVWETLTEEGVSDRARAHDRSR